MFNENNLSKIFTEPSMKITPDSIIDGVNKRYKSQKVKRGFGTSLIVILLVTGLLLYKNNPTQHFSAENLIVSNQIDYDYLTDDDGFLGYVETDALFWGENGLAVGF